MWWDCRLHRRQQLAGRGGREASKVLGWRGGQPVRVYHIGGSTENLLFPYEGFHFVVHALAELEGKFPSFAQLPLPLPVHAPPIRLARALDVILELFVVLD